MKVLHITPNYPTPEYPIFGIFVKEQIESLRKLGIECEVMYLDGKGRGFREYICYVPRLWWKVAHGHYDILHCHHALALIILMITGWPFFKKVVLSYQNDPEKEWGGLVFKIFYPFVSKFIVKNRSDYLRYSKVTYLPNGVNPDLFHPMDKMKCRLLLGLNPNKHYVLYMDSNKGVRTQKRKDRFDEVIRILNDDYGYHGKIECIALRNTPREKIPLYMNAIDLHLITSDYEGSPNSVKECICCNTPVVSTDVGNVKEMIGDIEGAYVTRTFEARELAECVNLVLSFKKSFEGREKFLSKGYKMERVAQEIGNIYNKIVSPN